MTYISQFLLCICLIHFSFAIFPCISDHKENTSFVFVQRGCTHLCCALYLTKTVILWKNKYNNLNVFYCNLFIFIKAEFCIKHLQINQHFHLVLKKAKSSLPAKLAQNISNKNGSCCNWESHCGSFSSIMNDLHRWNAINAVMLSCVRIMWDTSGRELNQFILMTDFGSGISEWSNQHLRCGAMRLVCWLVQLSNYNHCWGKVTWDCCSASRDLFSKCFHCSLCSCLLFLKNWI